MNHKTSNTRYLTVLLFHCYINIRTLQQPSHIRLDVLESDTFEQQCGAIYSGKLFDKTLYNAAFLVGNNIHC